MLLYDKKNDRRDEDKKPSELPVSSMQVMKSPQKIFAFPSESISERNPECEYARVVFLEREESRIYIPDTKGWQFG